MTINLSNIQYAYPDSPDKIVLDIPQWSVGHKEQIFVHGPSGSGKSTLLNLLSGMAKPLAGELTILDQRLDTMSPQQRDKFRANHIGYVFQQFNLIPYLNAVENIELAAHFSPQKHTAGLTQEIATLLNELNISDADRQKPTTHLSVGQQQRVAIARALINKPELLIADEPTSSLDERNRDSFMALLMTMVSEHNTTLVFVSHDMSLSRYFSRTEELATINRAVEAA